MFPELDSTNIGFIISEGRLQSAIAAALTINAQRMGGEQYATTPHSSSRPNDRECASSKNITKKRFATFSCRRNPADHCLACQSLPGILTSAL